LTVLPFSRAYADPSMPFASLLGSVFDLCLFPKHATRCLFTKWALWASRHLSALATVWRQGPSVPLVPAFIDGPAASAVAEPGHAV
jgi:hypothetical protein